MPEKLLDELIRYAWEDDNIRLMAMNGSRVNRAVAVDRFMDFDVVYAVRDPGPFLNEPDWSRRFGPIAISQTPFFMEEGGDEELIFMTWYEDGSRSDIRILELDRLKDYLREDTLTRIILDKDQRVTELPEPSAAGHWLKKPSEHRFGDAVNEFWWVSLYVTKALARDQYIAATGYLAIVREELIRVMAWNRAHDADYRLNFGGQWKFLEQHLKEEKVRALSGTFDLMDPSGIKRSLAQCRILFRAECREYAEKTGYSVPDYARRVLALEADWQ